MRKLYRMALRVVSFAARLVRLSLLVKDLLG